MCEKLILLLGHIFHRFLAPLQLLLIALGQGSFTLRGSDPSARCEQHRVHVDCPRWHCLGEGTKEILGCGHWFLLSRQRVTVCRPLRDHTMKMGPMALRGDVAAQVFAALLLQLLQLLLLLLLLAIIDMQHTILVLHTATHIVLLIN